jgi:glycyl-tRNA synthetase
LPESVKDFQSIVFALQKYWVDWGCTLWQPYYSQLGAGTMNPATFLRVLGPEPWNVAYLEPSVRPDDGRYGENPNRLQQHHQFQVILKPDPGNPQEAYLRSLEAIGINVDKHDIRFIEDNWTSPALGAWGLGWEVWLDGLEISQFTYFQQAGGLTLDPVSVEITYGLDRIAMALQGKDFVGDITWSPERTWADLNMQGEREHSKYYFELADVERLKKMYDLYEEEAFAALDAGLVLPAYDYMLKCSHSFNILDTRGAVGVTERQGYFRRMRKLSSKVAEAYVTDRQRLEYPWLEESASMSSSKSKQADSALAAPSKAADFLLEIGTEELPPGDLDNLLNQMRTNLHKLLKDLRLDYESITVHGTPRRLVAYIGKMAHVQESKSEQVKGPPAERAFDAGGNPSKAAEGFAKGQGVAVEELKVEEIDGGKYVVANVHEVGRSSVAALAAEIPAFIASLNVEKTMRWNASGKAFSRPIRWLLALHGSDLIPFEYASIQSAAVSRGLRLSEMQEFIVKSPEDYFVSLVKQKIILDEYARKAEILNQISKLSESVGAKVLDDAGLLDEVTHLVEAPFAMLGEFEAKFLDLPREALIAVMNKHQRYFPLEKDGKLINAFVAVGNGEFDIQAVTDGNADVISARFADAAYFVERDRKRSLVDFAKELKELTFQKELGSMWDKSQRIEKLVKDLAPVLALSHEEKKTALRAAMLAKADLASQMVVEMTSLQGTMGKYYALDSGESAKVAQAIEEHYLPRYAGDKTPESKAALAVGLADRLDTLAGLFALGLAPKGTKDPFALRRAAIGLVQALIAAKQDFELDKTIEMAAKQLPVKMSAEQQQACNEFILLRLQSQMIEEGYRHDIVATILGEQAGNPAQAYAGVVELSRHMPHKKWPDILDTYARCARITRDQKETFKLDEKLLDQEEEKALYEALKVAEAIEREAGDVLALLKTFMPMMPAIKVFFEKVMVNAKDAKLRQNRMALLQRITALTDGVADLSKMEGF